MRRGGEEEEKRRGKGGEEEEERRRRGQEEEEKRRRRGGEEEDMRREQREDREKGGKDSQISWVVPLQQAEARRRWPARLPSPPPPPWCFPQARFLDCIYLLATIIIFLINVYFICQHQNQFFFILTPQHTSAIGCPATFACPTMHVASV